MYFTSIGLVTNKDHNSTSYVPMRHCRIAYDNLMKGKHWSQASPAYPITRMQAAQIINEFK